MSALRVWLRFLSGGLAGQTRAISVAPGEAASIGRAEDNDVVLDENADFAASSHHARLMNVGGTLYLYDAGSTNGSWIGGQRVQQAPLPSGTRVTFGRGGPDAEVIWQPVTAPGAAPPPLAAPPFMAPPPPMAPPPAVVPPPAVAAQPAVAQADPFGVRPAAPAEPPVLPPPLLPSAPPPASPATAAPPLPPSRPADPKTEPREFRALPAMPSPAHLPEAYTEPPAPVTASDTCGMCGRLLFFICYQCRRTLCATHYEPATGVCAECAANPAPAAPPAPARPAAGLGVPPPLSPVSAYGSAGDEPQAAPVATAREDDPEMAIPRRRRKPAAPATPPGDDDLPPRRRAGPPPADDELPPRRRRPG
jgi:hypothetical protein